MEIVSRKRDSADGTCSWQSAMKSAVRDPYTLCEMLELSPEVAEEAAASTAGFEIFAPLSLVARMKKGDPTDPLLRQVLPVKQEMAEIPGYSANPLGEDEATLAPGLLQKYASRALLITTGACAVHCRYCFRRHFPYAESPPSQQTWDRAIEKIAEDSSLDEIILSGGDPLTLTDAVLERLAGKLADVPHLQRLRIHTRLPIVIPQRVTDELLAWLTGSRLTPIMVIHANHPREIDAAVASAIARLADGGIPVLNQTVLLAGINNSASILAELCRKLVDLRVMPYYLHQLDRVAGAAHFETPLEEGIEIIRQLHAMLPGYAVPRFVQEIPGQPGKTVLA